ncbi:hypothetical protein HPP92_015909 [Vanilla planifolia]|uniref:Uncharacterized protein n=1 Tax=Vanilla planifolia TaxID=51239 RepID=A0A835UU44_VANPL|nr:hypothetical protein HPP92_015909 [Vanilla planifolia]
MKDLERNGIQTEEDIYNITYYGKGRMPSDTVPNFHERHMAACSLLPMRSSVLAGLNRLQRSRRKGVSVNDNGAKDVMIFGMHPNNGRGKRHDVGQLNSEKSEKIYCQTLANGPGTWDTLEVKPREKGLDTRLELMGFHEVLVKAVPIKEGHTLRVIWPVTPGIRHYKEGPSRYLSHLIGHEGEGSLFYILKNLSASAPVSSPPVSVSHHRHQRSVTSAPSP